MIESAGICRHKPFWPLYTSEWFGLAMVALALFISCVGGMGGGGIVIPIAIFFFNFDTKSAIGISNASICVSSIVRYLYNFNASHPDKNGKGIIVDYNIASLMLPGIVMGASFGVIVNQILPEIIIVICLSLLLILLTFVTCLKLSHIIKHER